MNVTTTTHCPECKTEISTQGLRIMLNLLDAHRLDAHGIPIPPSERPFTEAELVEEIGASMAYLDDPDDQPTEPNYV